MVEETKDDIIIKKPKDKSYDKPWNEKVKVKKNIDKPKPKPAPSEA